MSIDYVFLSSMKFLFLVVAHNFKSAQSKNLISCLWGEEFNIIFVK
jgi:hypothetical protein